MAESMWMEGRFDDAFDALDEAFRIMAEVEVDGDALVAQEKEDLRRLISRRIVEIYASQQTVVGDFEGSIPLEVNAYVEREIASFQGAERQSFLEGYQRSGLYRPMIVAKLREAGLPEQLSWLPMIESWFKTRALSSARALGMWQFISSTGYRYGLKRTSWADERMDPEKATDAALAYLKDLHGLFGDWQTAVAAYNCGEARVQRLLRRQSAGYFDQFWDLYEQLPRETRRYVPRLIAAVLILEDPAKYGFHDLPEPLAPVEVKAIETTRSIRLADLDAQLELPSGTLAELNPELRAQGDSRFALPTRRSDRPRSDRAGAHRGAAAGRPETAQDHDPSGSPWRDPVDHSAALRHLGPDLDGSQQPAQRQPHLARAAAEGGRPGASHAPGVGSLELLRSPWRQPVEHRPPLRHHRGSHQAGQQPAQQHAAPRAAPGDSAGEQLDDLHRSPRRHLGPHRRPEPSLARPPDAGQRSESQQHDLSRRTPGHSSVSWTGGLDCVYADDWRAASSGRAATGMIRA